MIPEKIEQLLKDRNEPDFFVEGNRSAYDDIHAEISQYVKHGTDSITFSVDAELLLQAEAVLETYGWTVEEAIVLFLMWCVTNPERLPAWYEKSKEDD